MKTKKKRSMKTKKKLLFIVLLVAMISSVSLYATIQSYAAMTSETVVISDGYAWPNAQPVQTASTNGLTIGTLNQYKTVVDSTKVDISGLPKSRYAVTRTEITVTRLGYDGKSKQTLIGQALIFVDENQTSDNGWVMVNLSEAQKWVEVFNGNPAYVFGGSSIYSHTIDDGQGVSYPAYNLADIATASGGRGVTFGFKQVSGEWKHYTTYEATPRPTGWLKVDQDSYKIGDTVQITAGGTDYSTYDNGIKSVSLSVINKTAGKGHQQVSDATTLSYKILPEYGEGEYEVTYVMTDKHRRTSPDSPSMSEAKPLTLRFYVGSNVCTPIQVQVKYIGNGKTETQAAGGSAKIPAGTTSVELTAPVNGDFYVDGKLVGSNTTKVTVPYPGRDFKINFEYGKQSGVTSFSSRSLLARALGKEDPTAKSTAPCEYKLGNMMFFFPDAYAKEHWRLEELHIYSASNTETKAVVKFIVKSYGDPEDSEHKADLYFRLVNPPQGYDNTPKRVPFDIKLAPGDQIPYLLNLEE